MKLLPVLLMAAAGFVAFQYFYPRMPSSEPSGGAGGGAPVGGAGNGGGSGSGSGASAPPPNFTAQLNAKAASHGLSTSLNADEWNWVTQQLTGGSLPAPELFLPEGMARDAKMSAADYVRYITGSGHAPAGVSGVWR